MKIQWIGFGLCFLAQGASAGVYGGYDSNDEGGRIGFLGFQVGGPVVLDVFLADLSYRYIENGVTVSVNRRVIEPTVGYRWEGTWSTTVLIGPSIADREEDRGPGSRESAETGGVVKVGVYSSQSGFTTEALASYATRDQFLWSRARLTRVMTERLAPGLETFWMGDTDADSYGAGAVLGIDAGIGKLTFRLGYQRSMDKKDTWYNGLEGAIFF